MRIFVYFVIGLLINNTIAHTPSKEITVYDYEDSNSQVQSQKVSSKTKKDKFSCILSLLKTVLAQEIDNQQCDATEIEDLNTCKNVPDEKKTIDSENIIENEKDPESDKHNTIDVYAAVNIDPVEIEYESKGSNIVKANENGKGIDKTQFEKFVAKVTQIKSKYCKNNTKNSEVPNMIPIFKPRTVFNNDFGDIARPVTGNINPAREVGNLIKSPECVQGNSNPIYNTPKFTIPCQRAADVLDMTIATPFETKRQLKPSAAILNPANQTPSKVSVQCVDLDDSLCVLFKPKAISLLQLYGNLLKKITMTVLVPYHVSKHDMINSDIVL